MHVELGFLLPLSGGADSASVAAIVRVMCHLAVTTAFSVDSGSGGVTVKDLNAYQQVTKLLGKQITPEELRIEFLTSDTVPTGTISNQGNFKAIGNELCNSVLHTVYMGTTNSSVATRSRAERLAAQVGGFHYGIRCVCFPPYYVCV